VKKTSRPIVRIAILLILLGGAFYFYQAKGKLVEIDYQAVFLDNGQVYFGRVSNKESVYVKLTDIYYLQSKQSLQNQTKDGILNQPDLALIKLGKELHGPRDEMEINRDHILFIETLADDSRVVRAIREYESNE